MKNKKLEYTISACFLLAVFFGLSVLNVITPKPEYIDSERRPAAQKPEFTKESFLDGSFTKDFETYTTDTFFSRDTFREIKAKLNYDLFQKQENNDIYRKDGSLMKLEHEINPKSTEHAMKRFQRVYDMYLAKNNCKVYSAIVPDKAYFAWKDGSVPTLDYNELYDIIKEGMPYAEQIDVTDVLSLSDFYLTDTHWRQEKIIPVAKKISEAMGNTYTSEFKEVKADVEFRGVNSGHSALTTMYDELFYLTNDTLENCKTVNLEKKLLSMQPKGEKYDESKETVYNMEKLASKDPYEMFLSGACSAITMENPANPNGKHLVIFRDSYGSSIAPLLLENYSRVTLFDIRYVAVDYLRTYTTMVPLKDADVLFLYSTTLINNSSAIK